MYERKFRTGVRPYIDVMSKPSFSFRNKFLSLLAMLIAVFVGLASASSAVAVGNLDQQATGTSTNWYYSMDGGYIVGQVFTPTVSGTLDRITMDVLIAANNPGPMTADLYATDVNGFPTGPVLASTSVPQASISLTVSTVPFDFGTPATMVAGTAYVAVFGNTGAGSYHYMNATVTPAGAKAIKKGPSTAWANHTDTPAESSFRFATYISPGASPSPSASASTAVVNPTLALTGIQPSAALSLLGMSTLLVFAGGITIAVAR
ncbi:MAG: hypothetical protein RI926_551, partial [Actinomycetota bacterium]